jgi:hypothetical protein
MTEAQTRITNESIDRQVVARHLAGQIQEAEREMSAEGTPQHLWWKEFGRQDTALRLTAEFMLWPEVNAILEREGMR